jgi:hypothetical protein
MLHYVATRVNTHFAWQLCKICMTQKVAEILTFWADLGVFDCGKNVTLLPKSRASVGFHLNPVWAGFCRISTKKRPQRFPAEAHIQVAV